MGFQPVVMSPLYIAQSPEYTVHWLKNASRLYLLLEGPEVCVQLWLSYRYVGVIYAPQPSAPVLYAFTVSIHLCAGCCSADRGFSHASISLILSSLEKEVYGFAGKGSWIARPSVSERVLEYAGTAEVSNTTGEERNPEDHHLTLSLRFVAALLRGDLSI